MIEGEDEDVVTIGEAKKIEAKVMTSIEKAQGIVKAREKGPKKNLV
ncbi:unnamed protein product [marine sediment metagenome]|uniref:Uncharacterized protein n=1 Tax=marine sediment metagenome TaxID=412755 RepID=X1MGK4_9ZZZZ